MMRLVEFIVIVLLSSNTFASGDFEYSKCVKAQNELKPDAAINFCSAAIAQGHIGAKLTLGHIYFTRENPNYDLASKWYKDFTESEIEGYQYGFAMLGHVAFKQEKYSEAMKWYKLCNEPPYKGCQQSINRLKKYIKNL